MAWFRHRCKPDHPACLNGGPGDRLNLYLDELRAGLKLDPGTRKGILLELLSHVQDRIEELKDAGVSPEKAKEDALHLFGSPRLVAKQIYELHTQGSWRQAALAALPHLLFALLFALHRWQNLFWLFISLGVILGFTAYGWWHGKPSWLFSWLGYSLIPVIVAGVLLIYLPSGWSWLSVLAYLPFALWLLASATRQTLQRDWLYSSLMFLPIPVIACWLMALRWEGMSLSPHNPLIHQFAPWIAMSFAALAVAAATFMRLRQRWLKAGALLTPELSILVLIGLSSCGELGLWGWLILALLSSTLFLSPVILERKLARDDDRELWDIPTSEAVAQNSASRSRPA